LESDQRFGNRFPIDKTREKTIGNSAQKVVLLEQNGDLDAVVRRAMTDCGLLDNLSDSSRVSLKPNLTYPYHKRGVTTSPAVVEATVRILRDYTKNIAIVECDGGYGAWKVETAFEGHGLFQIGRKYGIEVASLHDGPRESISFHGRGQDHEMPLPVRLLHETDLFITMPVPKIHCMTGLTLAHKNQWGCIPDDMRMRRHYVFNDAIVAINRALNPRVLADGTYFLDNNGPMDGDPVRMNLIIAATDAGSFDHYVAELMGWSWRRVPHLRRAVELGSMPSRLEEIDFNVAPSSVRTRVFKLKRTLRNYLALSAFVSRFITWFGYEFWFGRVVLHKILYAIVGENVPPQPEDADLSAK